VQVRVTNPWRHESAALHSNLQAAQDFGNGTKRIVGAIQTVQSARMILFVETLRPDQQVQVSEGALNFGGLVIWGAWRNPRDRVRQRT